MKSWLCLCRKRGVSVADVVVDVDFAVEVVDPGVFPTAPFRGVDEGGPQEEVESWGL